MNIRKKITLLLMLTLLASASAQVRIPGTRLSFTLPDNEWKYLKTTTVDNNTTVYLYAYVAEYVLNQQGDTILPFMRVFVQKDYKGTVYDLAYSRFMKQPFQSLDEHVLDNGGLEYLGAYTNERDQIDYEFRMLYLKDQNTIFEIRLETTVDTFDSLEDSFDSIMKSVSINK